MTSLHGKTLTISEDDLIIFNRVIKSIASEYNPVWHGADIYLEEDELELIRRIFVMLPEEE